MSTSVIGVDEGTDKYWDTDQRTKSGNDKQALYVVREEQPTPTYIAIAKTIITTTSASHLIFIQGDGTNYGRLRRLFVRQVVGATTATLAELSLFRTSTAGTGGGAITARPWDSADSAFGGTIQTLPTAKGTEGVELWHERLQLLTTAQVAATTVNPNTAEWVARDGEKPIVFGSATTDGLALKLVTGIATSTLDIMLEFTLTAYL
jgi:hypothetical protein